MSSRESLKSSSLGFICSQASIGVLSVAPSPLVTCLTVGKKDPDPGAGGVTRTRGKPISSFNFGSSTSKCSKLSVRYLNDASLIITRQPSGRPFSDLIIKFVNLDLMIDGVTFPRTDTK